jgi:16S rRNA (guanine527-N7)-methyltransferase
MEFEFTPDQKEKLDIYHRLLLKWQKSINLVSPKTLEDAWQRHFIDSAQLLPLIQKEGDVSKLVDVGSGAGFPGMVLAILHPEIHVTMIESDQRKSIFLQNVSRETSTPATILNERIEAPREPIRADIMTARALASLSELCAYSVPFYAENPDLVCYFPKGKFAISEHEEAQVKYSYHIDFIDSYTDVDAKIIRLSGLVLKK